MKVKSILFLLSIIFFRISNSQNVKGFVYDTDNHPVFGVLVENLKDGSHTHSQGNGAFVLQNATLNDTLLFVFISFKSKKIVVTDTLNPIKVFLDFDAYLLDEIRLSNTIDNLNVIVNADLKNTPVQSSQDLLRKVPGLFIGQHAGGGKAEQIFLRGFDIDHGTDINISVDGMPVNMVSHAHGQGYADLHFLIPELINKIEFDKGTYNAEKGNFATAGYVNFKTYDSLPNSSFQLERGQFNTLRSVTLLDLISTEKKNAYIATEYIKTDGPFISPQNFNRINLLAKYASVLPNGKDLFKLSASYFTSKWNASGQLPSRAVENGTISRFGAIDSTEGGKTDRMNLIMSFDKIINLQTFVENTIYLTKYNFDLFSNFTFFLEDSINGDQIHQVENRLLLGTQSVLNHDFHIGNYHPTVKAGIGLRNDQTLDSELSHTLNRKTVLNRMQFGDVNETNFFSFIDFKLNIKKFVINPSVRLDNFVFSYNNHLDSVYHTLTKSKSIISPKFNVLYNPSSKVQVYLKSGFGFHSNDTRTVVTDQNVSLPKALSTDLGTLLKVNSKMIVNLAVWNLHLQQEFVYVGDAGVVEAKGRTNRYGLDFGIRQQFKKWLFLDVDINYAHARFIDEPSDANYIPLAPNLTSTFGLSVKKTSGFYGGVRSRFMNHRAAIEDNSIIAEGYFITDLNFGYTWKQFDCAVNIQNIFNTEWKETQFATESRLKNEHVGVEEIHFTPGTPLFAKVVLKYSF